MAFVADNSVTIAWFVSGQADRYSRRMLERARREAIHAPRVWPLEFLNALRMLERRKRLLTHQVDSVVARLAKLQITVETEPVEMRVLLELARRFDLSAYDASYLELAMRRGLPLATRDVSLARAARAAGIPLA